MCCTEIEAQRNNTIKYKINGYSNSRDIVYDHTFVWSHWFHSIRKSIVPRHDIIIHLRHYQWNIVSNIVIHTKLIRSFCTFYFYWLYLSYDKFIMSLVLNGFALSLISEFSATNEQKKNVIWLLNYLKGPKVQRTMEFDEPARTMRLHSFS